MKNLSVFISIFYCTDKRGIVSDFDTKKLRPLGEDHSYLCNGHIVDKLLKTLTSEYQTIKPNVRKNLYNRI